MLNCNKMNANVLLTNFFIFGPAYFPNFSIIIIFINCLFNLFLFHSEYTTFAHVTIDHRGYRRLLHNGFRFGIHYQHSVNNEISWRCTRAVKPGGRCSARVRTRLVNGYEMLKCDNVKHDH